MEKEARSSWRRRSALAVVSLLLALAAYFALRPAAVPVDLALVKKGVLRVTVDEEGKTRIKQVFVVSAPITGLVLRSALEVGDAVERNATTVAAIEPSPPPFFDARGQTELEAQIKAADAAVELAKAELAQMEAELAFAEKELERAKALSARDVVAERVLQKADLDVATRQAALAKARAGLTVRIRELESLTARRIGPASTPAQSYAKACCVAVTSPISGRVLAIHKKSEQIVLQGTPLLEVGDPASLEIIVDLLSADAVRIKAGARASVSAWGGSDELVARVTRIEPAGFTKVSALGIEEQRVRVVLDFDKSTLSEAARRLGHDYRVFVQITVAEIADAILVPLGALFRNENRWSAYIAVNGRAELRTLEIANRDQLMAEVVSGLAVDERIILHPSDRIAHGVRITERVVSR